MTNNLIEQPNTSRDAFPKWYNRRFANRTDDSWHGEEDMQEAWQAAQADILAKLSCPELVEIVQSALYKELMGWDDGDPHGRDWRIAMAKAALAVVRTCIEQDKS